MPTVSAYVDVDVDVALEDFDDEDLIDEMENRGLEVANGSLNEIITSIWLKRRLGAGYQIELDQLIYQAIGKIV